MSAIRRQTYIRPMAMRKQKLLQKIKKELPKTVTLRVKDRRCNAYLHYTEKGEKVKMKSIQMIDIGLLEPHPKNPRKQIGDVTHELYVKEEEDE